MTADPSWADLRGSLPDHDTEVMVSHQGTAGTGTPAPEPDHGQADDTKYSC